MNLVRAHVTPMAACVCPGVRGRVFQFCACKVGARKQNSLPPSQARGAGKRTLGYDSLSWRSKLAFEKHSHEHFPSHHISVLVMALPATFPTVHHSPAVKEIFGSFKHEFFVFHCVHQAWVLCVSWLKSICIFVDKDILKNAHFTIASQALLRWYLLLSAL
jgi:hypothetical protein